jgi:hypothetical protein
MKERDSHPTGMVRFNCFHDVILIVLLYPCNFQIILASVLRYSVLTVLCLLQEQFSTSTKLER